MGLRVVVVDNDPDALQLAVIDLGLEGHEVVGQGDDGSAAIRLARELNPDVLVVDYRMPPGPSGLDVAQTLAAEHTAMRVIVYSNYQSPEVIAAVYATGADFLPKGNLRALRRAVLGG